MSINSTGRRSRITWSKRLKLCHANSFKKASVQPIVPFKATDNPWYRFAHGRWSNPSAFSDNQGGLCHGPKSANGRLAAVLSTRSRRNTRRASGTTRTILGTHYVKAIMSEKVTTRNRVPSLCMMYIQDAAMRVVVYPCWAIFVVELW